VRRRSVCCLAFTSDQASHIPRFLQPIPEKAARTALHLAIRELFQGELESSVADDPRAKVAVPVDADPNGTKFIPDAPTAPSAEDGQKIVIKYSKGRRGKDGGGWMSSDSRSGELKACRHLRVAGTRR
jgi:hypothetical protein